MKSDLNLEAYIPFSKFFSQLAAKRRHFELQHELALRLFGYYGLATDSRVLDAACGTGDVVLSLHKSGFTQLFAIDGSEAMLQHLLPRLPTQVKAEHWQWEHIGEFFLHHGHFDAVFLLGHSLPHLDLSELDKFLVAVKDGLNPKGMLMFDIRPWVLDENGQLRASNREIGKSYQQGRVVLDNASFDLTDMVEYEEHRQIVSYTLTPIDGPGPVQNFRVAYSPYSEDEAISRIRQAGFEKVDTHHDGDWPYFIVVGRKS